MSDRARPFRFEDSEIARLAASLREAGFTEDGIAKAAGARSIARLSELAPEIALAHTVQPTPLNVLTRLFVIGTSVPAPVAVRTLGLPLDRLVSGGLLERTGKDVEAKVKLIECEGVVCAFDRSRPSDRVEAPDFVMGPSDSARRLASLVLAGSWDDVLDLGAGCGLLALVLARSAKRVVATDVNARATAFAAFNAKLNGVDVECLTSDLFAALAGRTFDLVISNPPFVISPEDRLVYLNGGMKADGFCRRIAAEAPGYLREGGILQMLTNWVVKDDEPWEESVGSWFSGNGCDAWVMRSQTTEPEAYARAWMGVGRLGPAPVDEARLQQWLDYYREEQITAIDSGLVTMRKRAGDNWVRAFDGPVRLVPPLGEAMRERFSVVDVLARKRDEEMLDLVLTVNPDTRLTQDLRPTADGWSQVDAQLRLPHGLAYVETVDVYVAELVIACNGARTVRAAIDHAANAMGWSKEDVPEETLGILRQLAEEGFLEPRRAGG